MVTRARWAPARVVREGTPGAGVRVAVAGASHWHLPRHAEHLRQAGVTFVGVSDPDPEVAARWSQDLDCPAFPDTAELLGARPDLALAVGPVSEMAAQARVLLDAGVPLLAEKPLGLNGDEVQTVADAARRRGAWISVALVQRYDPLWGVLDALRESDRLGGLSHLHVRIVNGPPQRYAVWGSGWMLDPRTAGGGALLNLGIHGVDYMHHLVGGAPEVAGAALGYGAHRQAIEDFGAVILRSPGGVVGTVEAGYTYPDASAGMTRSGDNEVRVGSTGTYLTGRDGDAWQVTAAAGEESLPGVRAGDRYREWIFDSLARLRAGSPPLAGIEDCLAAVRTLDAAYARAR